MNYPPLFPDGPEVKQSQQLNGFLGAPSDVGLQAAALDQASLRTISDDLTAGREARRDQELERLLQENGIISDYPNPRRSGKKKKNQRQPIPLPPDMIEINAEDEMQEEGEDIGNSSGLKTIYMIHCSGTVSRHHTAIAYEDQPRRPDSSDTDTLAFTYSSEADEHEASDSESGSIDQNIPHINGTKPIHDLKAFMDDEKEEDEGVILVRHVHCSKNRFYAAGSSKILKFYEKVAIKSVHLRNIIASVAQCDYLDNSFDFRSPDDGDKILAEYCIGCEKPFLFHHLPLLKKHAKDNLDEESYIASLIDYCAKKYGADFEDAQKLFDAGLVTPKHLEKLFVPNTVALNRQDNAAFVVTDWPNSLGIYVTVRGWSWSPSRSGCERKSSQSRIECLSASATSITSLSVFPLHYASKETEQVLEKRGRTFWSIFSGSHISYTGYDVPGEQYYPGSRFMIDYQLFEKMHRLQSSTMPPPPLPLDFSGPERSQTKSLWAVQLEKASEPSQSDFLVMPKNVHGFYLMEKQWILLDVDNVSDIKWNKTAFDRLVLPSDTKELIRALVTVRTLQRGIKHGFGATGKRTDIISGKGNGLIMLLHGGPGTGKTLTAESVAEIAEMPLYRVTCGDIGSTPEAVEKYLGLVTYLGTRWNCVLLLDEADVFLEERSMSDLTRNSLVSVFLRVLEYYDGILILTSNRVGTFDDAFRSRIQVAIHYETLTKPARKKIWTNFLDMLEEDEEDADIPELRLHVDDLARAEMNGREIRNTVTTARQLAVYQQRRLDWEHFERTLKVSVDFNAYLKRVHGHTEDQRARDERLR
ncbi:MAG: hypothetical protein M1821_009671 [Bathelium mastoideum]|nr:MAG: hypothetical protein M1821_009671 [Bathelium mastoideum]